MRSGGTPVRSVGCIAALVWFFLGPALPAEDGTKLIDRIRGVDAATSLDAAGVPPWHVKMAVQLFGPKGEVAEQGLIEEWWGGRRLDRVVYALPSYKAIEVSNAAGFFRTKGAEQPPWMLELLRDQVVHPMPPEGDFAGTRPVARRVKFGKASFECVMLSRPIKVQVYFPIGVFPTYCMDAGGALRAAYDYGSQLILRNEVEEFEGRAVARDISIAHGGVLAATARVFKLEAKAGDEAAFATSDDMEQVERPVRVGAATMAGLLISKVDPSYPAAAKERQAAGDVIVQAVIGRHGRVRFVRLVAAPDPALGDAAMAALKQRVYRPYLVNGAAVEVETTMIVSFSIAE